MLSVLLSTRIRADLAVDATRALVDAGAGTPERMAAMSWQDQVDALDKALAEQVRDGDLTRPVHAVGAHE